MLGSAAWGESSWTSVPGPYVRLADLVGGAGVAAAAEGRGNSWVSGAGAAALALRAVASGTRVASATGSARTVWRARSEASRVVGAVGTSAIRVVAPARGAMINFPVLPPRDGRITRIGPWLYRWEAQQGKWRLLGSA